MESVDKEYTLLELLEKIDIIIVMDFITNEITALMGCVEMFGENLEDVTSDDWNDIQILAFFHEKHLNLLNELRQHCKAVFQANPKTDLDNRALETLREIEEIDTEIQRCNDHIRQRSLVGIKGSIQKLNKYTLKGSGRISNGWQ